MEMSWSEGTPSTERAQRDAEFYFKDIIILVEGYLFKVPVYHFVIESEVFGNMFQIPQNPDGSSDDQPLRLEGVKKDDFRQLLRVMFARSSIDSITLEQWISVLGLSTQWEMERIRTLAIEKIKTALDTGDFVPHRLLTLGQRYRVDEWVLAAITLLIKRAEPMGLNDVETIGIENVLKIASLRECCQSSSKKSSSMRMVEARGPWVGGDLSSTERIKVLFGLSTTNLGENQVTQSPDAWAF